MNYIEVIEKWKINRSEIARRIKMPIGTFNNKINEGQSIYKFTDIEVEQIKSVLLNLASDIISLTDKTKEITFFKLEEVSILADGSHGIGISNVVYGADLAKEPTISGEVKVVYEAGGRGGGKTAKTKIWIKSQIKAIEAEKIPKERNTPFGKKIWQAEQQKRIDALKDQLK